MNGTLAAIQELTGEQCRSALNFLSGWDQYATEAAVAYAKDYVPKDYVPNG